MNMKLWRRHRVAGPSTVQAELRRWVVAIGVHDLWSEQPRLINQVIITRTGPLLIFINRTGRIYSRREHSCGVTIIVEYLRVLLMRQMHSEACPGADGKTSRRMDHPARFALVFTTCGLTCSTAYILMDLFYRIQ
jgi:hypothetical protein